MGDLKFSHFGITARDLQASERWYCEVLGGEVHHYVGMSEADQKAGRVPQVDVIVGGVGVTIFQGDPTASAAPTGYGTHWAWHVETADDLEYWVERLKAHEIPIVGPSGHGKSTALSVYFDDIDGYNLEISASLTPEEFKRIQDKYGVRYGGRNRAYEWDPASAPRA